MNKLFWYICENFIYRIPEPPPRVRSKPLQVICVGFPRSATESLQHALITLGYDYTFHGWDILFEDPLRIPGWVRLAKKKWFGGPDGDCHISAAEFDALLGHSVAVTDAAASCFAMEMIEAYPEAKVVLNIRRDMDAWHQSVIESQVKVQQNWLIWFLSWFNAELFWMWHVYNRFLWYQLFRCTDSSFASGITVNGKRLYREHCYMIRGLVPKEKLLEWEASDGWEPLCKFLGKDIPNVPFPRTNNAVGFQGRIDDLFKKCFIKGIINIAISIGILTAGFTLLYKYTG